MNIVMGYAHNVSELRKWFTRKNIGAVDLTVETKNNHRLQLYAREYGFRLELDGKTIEDIDFTPQ